jgi:hypothetical protein
MYYYQEDTSHYCYTNDGVPFNPAYYDNTPSDYDDPTTHPDMKRLNLPTSMTLPHRYHFSRQHRTELFMNVNLRHMPRLRQRGLILGMKSTRPTVIIQ